MSLIGKILAFLNLLGVVAFGYVASLDYSKQQSWKYANFQFDLVSSGLPLDARETDKSGEPIAERINPQALRELFPQGNPVSTQLDEIKRVKDLFDQTLASVASDKGLQVAFYARYLQPLAETYAEHEKLRVLIENLSGNEKAGDGPKKLDLLKTSLYQGIGGALRVMRPDLEKMRPDAARRSFADAMHEWMNLQHLPPREVFVQGLLEALPREGSKPADEVAIATLMAIPAVSGMDEETDANRLAEAFLQTIRNEPGKPGMEIFGTLFDTLLGKIQKQLQTNFDQLFQEATAGQIQVNPGTREMTPPMQKQKIASLLFNLTEVLPDPANPKTFPVEKPHSILQEPAYRRVISVVGLPAMAREMEQSAQRIRTISGEASPTRDRDWLLNDPAVARALDALNKDTLKKPEELAKVLANLGVGAPQSENLKTELQREQTAFVLSHIFWVNYLQERASQVDQLVTQIERAKMTADGLDAVVKRRQADIEHWKNELAQYRAETDKQSQKLDGMRQELFQLRLDLRNKASLNQQTEQEITRMEDRVR